MYFGIFGLFCTINCYFEYRIRIVCIFLYVGTYFEDFCFHSTPKIEIFRPPQIEHLPRSVNNFRIRDFWPTAHKKPFEVGGEDSFPSPKLARLCGPQQYI